MGREDPGGLLLPVMTTFISSSPDPGCLWPLLPWSIPASRPDGSPLRSFLSFPFLPPLPLSPVFSHSFSLTGLPTISLCILAPMHVPLVCFSFPIFLPLCLVLHFFTVSFYLFCHFQPARASLLRLDHVSSFLYLDLSSSKVPKCLSFGSS